MTKDDAQQIGYEADNLAGSWALETIDVETVLECARDRWHEFPGLEDYAWDAASRVWSKWSGNGDTTAAAVDWAMNLIEEYAEQDGVVLLPLDEATT